MSVSHARQSIYMAKNTIFTRTAVATLACVAVACSQPSQPEADSFPIDLEEAAFEGSRTVSQHPITTPLSSQESLSSFRLPPGYRLELVASEPMISEPSALAWDGNGRMYVAQLETYMQTMDAQGQDEPRSRIMRLEDIDHDGTMDKSTVFLDKLLSPRAILCVGDELLVNETNTFDIMAYRDSDGDGVADQERTVFSTDQKAYGNVEHQRSGLDWNLDNWIYVTTDPVRFRYRNGKLQADSLPYGNNGQWGLTHDDYGRLFYSRAAGGIAATGFQINPIYGQLNLPDAYDSSFHQVWPAIKTPDVNGGPRTLRPDSTMRGFTAVCGQSVFRGDRLPASTVGDYFVAEPVGRLIRRAEITHRDGKTHLRNVYEQDEFITSTDMNFRPINTYTGPDGCLYIVDMYRGVIQESTWAQPGSYLYGQIMQKDLHNNVKRGRIYRLVHNDIPPGPMPRMLNEPIDQLLTYLDHPNGWWRDNAQKEVIVRGDHSVVSALRRIVRGEAGPLPKEPSALARLHALWTLEGLDALNQNIVREALKDPDAEIRKAAVRMSEAYLNNSDPLMLEQLAALKDDNSHNVRTQLVLSLYQSQTDEAVALAETILANSADNAMMAGIRQTLEKNEASRKYGAKLVVLDEEDRHSVMRGATIFQTLCVACHGPEGQGLPTEVAPPLITKFKLIEHKEGMIKIMLHGLEGPIDGKTYPEMMPPMGANDDEWIAAVANYVRYDLCMKSFPDMSQGYIDWVMIKPEDVKKVRDQYSQRKQPWTWTEIKSDDKKVASR